MGLSVSKLSDGLWGKKEVKISLFGLAASGKTTILYKLKTGEVMTTMPTQTMIVETIQYKNINFIIWDTGTFKNNRIIYQQHYIGYEKGIIYVVDACRRNFISEARDELQSLLSEDKLREIPFLILANKADLPEAMSTDEIIDRLGLSNSIRQRWYVQRTSAIIGDGLFEGLEWLFQVLPLTIQKN